MGKPFKSSEPLSLTEKDFDYVVTCVKHTYYEHTVLHFKVENTLESQSIYNVQMRVALSEDEDLEAMESLYALPAKEIEPNCEASTFLVLKRDPDEGYPTGSCSVACVFAEEEGEDTDEYDLSEKIVINLSDYLAKTVLPNFESAWTAAGEDEYDELVYELDSLKNLQTAADEIIEFYGFYPHDGCQIVNDSGKLSHTLLLAGQVSYQPPFDILMKAVVCRSFFLLFFQETFVPFLDCILIRTFIFQKNSSYLQIALTESGTISLTLHIKGAYDDMRALLASSLTD